MDTKAGLGVSILPGTYQSRSFTERAAVSQPRPLVEEPPGHVTSQEMDAAMCPAGEVSLTKAPFQVLTTHRRLCRAATVVYNLCTCKISLVFCCLVNIVESEAVQGF